MRPRLLDLFCGAGGCSVGYHRAGFDVVGVDIRPQPNYPFEFVQADALEYVEQIVARAEVLGVDAIGYAAIHASPPCQAFSLATLYHGASKAADHPDLVHQTRQLLDQTGLPHVIENVEGAPLRRDLVLCGEMFGLRVHRHRVFELGRWFAMRPPHQPHRLRGAQDNCHIETGHARLVAGNYANHEDASDAMGIGWMNRRELSQAIPPAYTEFIGHQLLAHLEQQAAA